MSRQEEIAQAADEAFKTTDFYIPTFDILGFTLGANWADANPKPLWISVKNDLPYYHEYLLDTDISTKEVLVVLQYNEDPTYKEVKFCKMFNHKNMGTFNDRWYWNCPRCFKVTHWMSIPEIPR